MTGFLTCLSTFLLFTESIERDDFVSCSPSTALLAKYGGKHSQESLLVLALKNEVNILADG